jgi:DnaJ-class molecular chaperone
MKEYFETLNLKEGASKEAIQEAYDRLSGELNPSNNDNQEFFIEEYEKVQEAYEALYNSSILATEKGAKKNISDTKAPEVKKQNGKTLQFQKKSSKRDFVFGGFLFFITIGIWGIFLQNMGFFVPSDDYTQKVRVINTVDTYSNGGSINISGSVEVENTVDINISEVNGWNAKSYESGLLGVYNIGN